MNWVEKELKKAKIKKLLEEAMKTPEYKKIKNKRDLHLLLWYCLISVDFLFRQEKYGPKRVKRFLDFVKQQMKYITDDDEYDFKLLNDALEEDTGVNVMKYMGFWED